MSTRRTSRWGPALVLVLGAILTMGVARQQTLPLQRPLAEAVPVEILGFTARDVLISDPEAQVAGFSDYLFRVYELPAPAVGDAAPGGAEAGGFADAVQAGDREAGEPDNAEATGAGEGGESTETRPWFSLYVGYYESQAQGNTIHSPKNCLPGAGWEALSSRPQTLELDGRTVTVNRYLLQNEGQRALVLYWYQGRGRIANDEYRVKLDLLRDAALRRRSEEALVRIVVPITDAAGPDVATDLAVRAARIVAPSLGRALPR